MKEVKEGVKFVYYGGKLVKNVKCMCVCFWVMSIVLCWIFDEIGDVFIMGYKFLDMDVLGFVFGVSCFVCFN